MEASRYFSETSVPGRGLLAVGVIGAILNGFLVSGCCADGNTFWNSELVAITCKYITYVSSFTVTLLPDWNVYSTAIF